MTFYMSYYSTFNRNRTKSYIKTNAYGQITLPYPKQFNTLNTQNYTAGGSLNVQTVENRNLSIIGEEIAATQDLARSFFSGGSVIRFDHMETVLEPGARRTHNFEINLVAKTQLEAEAINSIAVTFQTNMFPIARQASLLTMDHPPLWYFEAFSLERNITDYHYYWDGNALPCVLKSVDINKSPILNTPFSTPDFKPLAVNIKLAFIELEPAMQRGNETPDLVSRAQRFTNQ